MPDTRIRRAGQNAMGHNEALSILSRGRGRLSAYTTPRPNIAFERAARAHIISPISLEVEWPTQPFPPISAFSVIFGLA